MNKHIQDCDVYLGERSGKYEWRCVRYDCTINAMIDLSLAGEHTVCDVGAGWTEFGARLFERANNGGTPGNPITGARPIKATIHREITGTDLEVWTPPRKADFFVALELLEHLEDPWRLVEAMQRSTERAILISTPNPRTTDVLGMDRTHKTPIHEYDLKSHGFFVTEQSFYGKPDDSLFGVWTPNG